MNHPTRSTPKWIWLLLALTVVAVLWGMARALEARKLKQQALAEATERTAPRLRIPAAEWLTAEQRPLSVGVPITGSLEAVDRAVVKARVPGELRDLQVREGDSVAQGQVIARVDATESEARFRQAKLQADAAQAQVNIQQRQYDNNQALVDKGFISSTALTTSLATLQAAQATYAAARAAQDAAQKTLDDTVLRSPMAGQIARRMAQNGERVSVDAPIVEVLNLDVLELEVQLPSNDSAQLQPGQTAQLLLRNSTGAPETIRATVVRINPSASTGNRAIPVYLRVQPSAAVTLRPGMYLEGVIQTGERQALAIPLSAVRTDQPLPYVQAVVQQQVQHLPVVLGVRSVGDSQTWVAVEGLNSGQALLTGVVGTLPAGTLVDLQTPAAAQ